MTKMLKNQKLNSLISKSEDGLVTKNKECG